MKKVYGVLNNFLFIKIYKLNLPRSFHRAVTYPNRHLAFIRAGKYPRENKSTASEKSIF